MAYVWENPSWPQFIVDLTQSHGASYAYAMEHGRLSGGSSQLDDDLQVEMAIDIMVREAISSSRIEGENLDQHDVRSSIRNYMGLNVVPVRVDDPRAEGIAALMVDVRQSFRDPLNEALLFRWHRMVMGDRHEHLLRKPISGGQWRQDPIQIVSGPIEKPVVHYEAPPPEQVQVQMRQFMNWYNDTNPARTSDSRLSGPARAAIAHWWFEVIHPFEDGNGRVGRAIAEHALMQDAQRPLLMSLSAALKADSKAYYAELNAASRASMDITPWVNWFCAIVVKAQRDAAVNIDFILQKSRFWARHRETDLNERQIKAVRRMFEAGHEGFAGGMNAAKFGSLNRCSKATATRDLTDLLDKGLLKKMGAGRSTQYELNIKG